MNQLQTFRQLCADYYESQLGTDIPSATTMWPFLALPIKERLVLLCLSEEATMELKAVLPYAKETDVRQTSHRMVAAIKTFNAAMDEPTAWLHPGPYPDEEPTDLTDPTTPFPFPDHQIPRDTDLQLRQVFFPEAAILLFGELVPAELAVIGLQARLALYCLAVEELSWLDIQALLGCSEWAIRQALKGGIEALEGV